MPLYVISTPIGNLSDISKRAIEILSSSDYVLCEDTRRTRKLFLGYDIKNKLISLNENNEKIKASKIIEDCRTKDIALVSDNGTPTISDPGFYLIRECHKNDVRIVPVPGPSAAIAALSVSGLLTDKFTFIGFLTKRKNKRKKELEKYMKGDYGSIIIYESPYRIGSLLKDIVDIDPECYISIARELTKRNEEIFTLTAKEILNKKFTKKGEFVVIINTNRKVFK